jgi:hypothetical protein
VPELDEFDLLDAKIDPYDQVSSKLKHELEMDIEDEIARLKAK